MVAENGLLAAMDEIEHALRRFVGNGQEPRVRVLQTRYGHIHAIVGSNEFKNLSIGRRQERIWGFLRNEVRPEYRGRLYGVTAMDEEEYDEMLREVERRAFERWTTVSDAEEE